MFALISDEDVIEAVRAMQEKHGYATYAALADVLAVSSTVLTKRIRRQVAGRYGDAPTLAVDVSQLPHAITLVGTAPDRRGLRPPPPAGGNATIRNAARDKFIERFADRAMAHARRHA